MRDLFVDFISVTQSFEFNAKGEEQLYGEVLFFPELRTFANRTKDLAKLQETIAQQILEHAPADEISRRMVPESGIEHVKTVVELTAPDKNPTWREPLQLEFDLLVWEHANEAKVGYVPGLEIEVVASDPKRFDDMVKDHILFAISRAGIRNSLYDLAILQRSRELTVTQAKWNAYPLTPKERHLRDEADEETKPVLSEIAKRLDGSKPQKAFERDNLIEQMAWMLGGRRATSVLLVGDSGTGKTAMVHHLAGAPGKYKIAKRPIFQTSGSRIVAGMTGFGEWQERCRKVVSEAKEQNAIIFFGNLFELMQVGQSSVSTESLASFFRPFLVRGEFLAVVECTPQQLALIEQIDGRVLDAFRQLKVEPSTEEQTLTILKKKRIAPVKAGALERLIGLQKRYSGYAAFPGKAVRFLEKIADLDLDEKKEKIDAAAVDQAFAAETGMPDFLINESIGIELDSVRDFFLERLKGQDDSVNLVVDTIAAIKTRLTRPGKPLASFLFIGPTGVGKTELAKTLAEFFYGSKERLIRLDMSEYSTPGSAGRLAAGGRNDEEGILTAQMRDQPFSVLLLDEFEKADSSVYDLFLQVLGEARLTDGAGRLADFSNAIIILTSNLGARQFRISMPGFYDSGMDTGRIAKDHFTDAVKKNFRPEFFNRIDRIVPFLPLSKDAVRAVVRRELELAERRDGMRNRNVSLIVPDFAVDKLAELGHDPRYGARPVKRAIERWLLAPVADFLCTEVAESKFENGFLEITGTDENGAPVLEFQKSTEETSDESRDKAAWFEQIPATRRDFQKLMASNLMNELQSRRNRIRNRLRIESLAGVAADHQQLADLNEIVARIEGQQEKILSVEEKLMLARFHEQPVSAFEDAVAEAPGENEFRQALLDTMTAVQGAPSVVTLVFRADDEAKLRAVVSVYREAALFFEAKTRLAYWVRHPNPDLIHPDEKPDPETGKSKSEDPRSKPVIPESKEEAENLLAESPKDFACLALEIEGTHSMMRFGREAGVHVFVGETGNRARIAIGFFDEGEKLEEAWLPETMSLVRDFSNLQLRRTWDHESRRMRDSRLGSSQNTKVDGRKLPWEFTEAALVELVDATVIAEGRQYL